MALRSRINLFAGDKHADLLITEVNAWATYYKRDAELVVIDTFSAASSGADENSGRDVGAVLERARRISRETKAHVAVVHHVPKSGGAAPRGWGGFLGNVDSAVLVQDTDEREYFTKDDGSQGERTVHMFTVVKQKDAELRFSRMFTLPQVMLGYDSENDKITSCIVKQLETVQEKMARKEVPPDWAQIHPLTEDIFRALVKALGKHGTAPPAEIDAPRDVKAACTVAQWQAELVDLKKGFTDITPELRKQISNRVYKALQRWIPGRMGIINKKDVWVWRTGRKVFPVDQLPRKTAAAIADAVGPPVKVLAPGEDANDDIPWR